MAHGAWGAPAIYPTSGIWRMQNYQMIKMGFERVKQLMVGSTLPNKNIQHVLLEPSVMTLRSPCDLRPLQQLAWHSSLAAGCGAEMVFWDFLKSSGCRKSLLVDD